MTGDFELIPGMGGPTEPPTIRSLLVDEAEITTKLAQMRDAIDKALDRRLSFADSIHKVGTLVMESIVVTRGFEDACDLRLEGCADRLGDIAGQLRCHAKLGIAGDREVADGLRAALLTALLDVGTALRGIGQ